MPEGHKIEVDRAGWGGHLRLTCRGANCNEATLVHQLYMADGVSGQRQWKRALGEFLKAHPSDLDPSTLKP